ncbi:MAG: AEC family transporter, partial [Verrucomicrobiales bacterium]|nr:AEC family transporter [Verrucomicrobiales bacterium]
KPPRVGGRIGLALAIRLVLAPLLAYPLTSLFGFDPVTSAVLVAGTAAPTAINIALIAHEFKADSRFASAVVFWSTLISVLTVSTVLAILSVSNPISPDHKKADPVFEVGSN